MSWLSYINGFKSYLMLERALSKHSREAYIRDVNKLKEWSELEKSGQIPSHFRYEDLADFIMWLNQLGIGAKSQARIISGIRSFYKYLLLEDVISNDPSELLESPKLKRTIPDILTFQEIESLFSAIDLSHPQGHRNRAILETLYACGIRVSELVNLKLSCYYPELEMIKVIGKNNKERWVPIGEKAIHFIKIYIAEQRNLLTSIRKEDVDILFLNRRGKRLSRVMIYYIIKEASQKAGMTKSISPHTFRHSFATHLVEGGADLKAVKDMLGHESITTTEIYTHLDTQYLRDTVYNFHPRNQRSIWSDL